MLVFRTVTEASSVTGDRKASVSGTGGDRISGPFQWMVPFKGYSAVNTVALYAQRHFHDFGTTPANTGGNRDEQSSQCGTESKGGVYGAAGYGGLPGGPYDQFAAVFVRL